MIYVTVLPSQVPAGDGPVAWWPQTMTDTNRDGHKVYHDDHSNENVKN